MVHKGHNFLSAGMLTRSQFAITDLKRKAQSVFKSHQKLTKEKDRSYLYTLKLVFH